MKRAAAVTRAMAVAASFLYMLLLLPHARGLSWEHLRSGWSVAGLVAAFLWVPLVIYHRYFNQDLSPLKVGLSFVPMVALVIFFSALISVATTNY